MARQGSLFQDAMFPALLALRADYSMILCSQFPWELPLHIARRHIRGSQQR
jgi:hypothetical protein